MLEIHLLEQLVAFANLGTLSLAAKKLHTSQPALTRSMKKIEDELGIKIFIRSSNRLDLNQTGRFMAERAQQVIKTDEDLIEQVKSYHRSLHTISVGYCAPLPQRVLNSIINNVFSGMTISSSMTDDKDFIRRVKDGDYQLAVVHHKPTDPTIYSKKIGHEDLYISLHRSNPLTFYPNIHLKDLNGLSILRLSQTGFWAEMCNLKLPDSHFLLQIDRGAFNELIHNSNYPSFVSGYDIKRGLVLKNQINVSILDEECHVDYYLICLREKQKVYRELFNQINDQTIS